jgi:CheY-like chemotaxis protein/HPt (histidine-containing phosphotransfer) domain-containing protein
MIMLSSVNMPGEPEERQRAGIDYYINKPARQAELYNCIAATLLGDAAPSDAGPKVTPAIVSASDCLAGLDILLAEDNPVNQLVAKGMLDLMGACVTLAQNGQEALDRLEEGHFDLLFIDCQMPVMDGLEATQEIRRRERSHGAGRRLPVIALTANAVAGDRELCLAAGMDDYLSKPFTFTELSAMAQRWMADLQSKPQADARFQPVPAQPPSGPPRAPDPGDDAAPGMLNRAHLEMIRQLSRDTGQDLLAQMVAAFISDAAARLGTMVAGLAGGDADAIRQAAHALKSASGNVGAEALSECCRELEALTRTGELAGAARLIDAARLHYSASARALEALLSGSTVS